jgi:hypothetical protein
MKDDKKRLESTDAGDEPTARRRQFLKSAATVATTTPAVALILSAGAKNARAGQIPSVIW